MNKARTALVPLASLVFAGCVTGQQPSAASLASTKTDRDAVIFDCKPDGMARHRRIAVLQSTDDLELSQEIGRSPREVNGSPGEMAVHLAVDEATPTEGSCDRDPNSGRFVCAATDESLILTWPAGQASNATVAIAEQWLLGTRSYTAQCGRGLSAAKGKPAP